MVRDLQDCQPEHLLYVKDRLVRAVGPLEWHIPEVGSKPAFSHFVHISRHEDHQTSDLEVVSRPCFVWSCGEGRNIPWEDRLKNAWTHQIWLDTTSEHTIIYGRSEVHDRG